MEIINRSPRGVKGRGRQERERFWITVNENGLKKKRNKDGLPTERNKRKVRGERLRGRRGIVDGLPLGKRFHREHKGGGEGAKAW